MESWENKIIRDKLDSLQGLPAGYLPNMVSKWEIIEAGLPQPKKPVMPLLIRWAVAAAIIACIITAGIKLHVNNKTGEGMIATLKMPLFSIPTKIQKEKTTIATKPVLVKNNLQIINKPAPVYHAEIIAKQDNRQLKNKESEIDLLTPVIDSAIVNTDELATIIPQQETPKRSKRRTFQKDFNDGLLVMDTGYSRPSNPQFGFKLQLHKLTADDDQPSRRLQLKQVL